MGQAARPGRWMPACCCGRVKPRVRVGRRRGWVTRRMSAAQAALFCLNGGQQTPPGRERRPPFEFGAYERIRGVLYLSDKLFRWSWGLLGLGPGTYTN